MAAQLPRPHASSPSGGGLPMRKRTSAPCLQPCPHCPHAHPAVAPALLLRAAHVPQSSQTTSAHPNIGLCSPEAAAEAPKPEQQMVTLRRLSSERQLDAITLCLGQKQRNTTLS